MPDRPLIISTAGVLAELAAAENQRLVRIARACLRAGQQRRDALISVLGQLAVVLLDVIVTIPRLNVTMVELDEPYAPLDQALRRSGSCRATLLQSPGPYASRTY